MFIPFTLFLIAISAMMGLVAILDILAKCCGLTGPKGNRTGGSGDDYGGFLQAGGMDLETGGGGANAPIPNLVDGGGSGGGSGWVV
jgi:hypothetical protein